MVFELGGEHTGNMLTVVSYAAGAVALLGITRRRGRRAGNTRAELEARRLALRESARERIEKINERERLRKHGSSLRISRYSPLALQPCTEALAGIALRQQHGAPDAGSK